MSERKATILNVSKGLLGVSFTELAAIDSVSIWLADLTAIPGAGLTASATIQPLLEKKKEGICSL